MVSGRVPLAWKPILLLFVLSCQTVEARTTVNVSTLPELLEAVQKDNQTIVMKPGRYVLTDLPSHSRAISCSGSNNTIVLSGVNVSAPVGCTSRSYITISGDNNTFKGGKFEDIYSSGIEEVTDFSAYNKDRSKLAKGLRGAAVFSITGDDNTVIGTKLTVRGSFPYGYGSMYGIGSDNVYGLDKRCGILIKGKSNTIDDCEVQQRAFGHGIYMQKPADRTVIRNSLVEGVMRRARNCTWKRIPRICRFDPTTACPLAATARSPRTSCCRSRRTASAFIREAEALPWTTVLSKRCEAASACIWHGALPSPIRRRLIVAIRISICRREARSPDRVEISHTAP